jgi:hypothetical protein
LARFGHLKGIADDVRDILDLQGHVIMREHERIFSFSASVSCP